MKTIKQSLFTVVFLMLPVGIFAADFNADGIYYNITGSNSVEVTHNAPDPVYSGKVDIPATVEYGGTIYNVTAIGEMAFAATSMLNTVTIPSSVTSIGNAVFIFSGLTNIQIPASVNHIGDAVFSSCTNLSKVEVSWNDLSSVVLGTNAFAYITAKLVIPYGTASLYLEDPTWSTFPNIMEYHPDFIVNGSGTLTGYTGTETDLIIPYGVKEIAKNAFYNADITSVVIPNSVTKIGEAAFSNCLNLTSVTIPNSVTSFDNFTFTGSTALEEINVSWTNPNTIANGGSISYYGNSMFFYVPFSCVVNVSGGLLADYNIFPWFYFDNVNGNTTSTKNIENSSLKIYSKSQTIYIEDATEPVYIYNVMGNCIAQGIFQEFTVPQSGIYIIHIGNHIQKIIVK